jgi:hypothetical protein
MPKFDPNKEDEYPRVVKIKRKKPRKEKSTDNEKPVRRPR